MYSEVVLILSQTVGGVTVSTLRKYIEAQQSSSKATVELLVYDNIRFLRASHIRNWIVVNSREFLTTLTQRVSVRLILF